MKGLERTRCGRSGWLKGVGCALTLALIVAVPSWVTSRAQTPATSATPAAATASSPGAPFTPEQLSSMLPATVYFAGKSASLQLRNAGGTKFANGTIVWVALVDSSGYSTSVQDRYQFYFVTEGPVRFGDIDVRAGAYGGGFVGDRFVLMDLGDHPAGEGATANDPSMRRPRPLQVLADQPDAIKLYLGRKWVTIRTSSH